MVVTDELKNADKNHTVASMIDASNKSVHSVHSNNNYNFSLYRAGDSYILR